MTTEKKQNIIECIHTIRAMMRDLTKMCEDAFYNLEDLKFGKLKVLRQRGKIRLSSNEHSWSPEYECVCDCGTELLVSHHDLIVENERSCGACDE